MTPGSTTMNHGTLLQLLSSLESAESGEALAQQLAGLKNFLQSHFQAEERPHGFFDSVTHGAPWHAARVDALRAEHGQFLEELAQLQRTVLRDAGAVSESTRDQLIALIGGLRRHETVEEQLLMETHATDLGGDQ